MRTRRLGAGRSVRQAVVPGGAAFVLASVLLLCGAASGFASGRGSSHLDFSSDGALLACVNRDNGSVTLVDAKSRTKLREIPVGRKPEGVTFLGDTHHLAVAVYADDVVVLLDGDTGAKLASVEVFDEPYGIVSDAAGKRLFATLEFPGRIVEIDPAAAKVVREIPAGSMLRGLALSADGTRLYATENHTARVVCADVASGKIVDEWPAPANDNLARQIVLHPSRPKAYLTHIRSRVAAAHGEGSIFPYVTAIDLRRDAERRRNRIPMDAFVGASVTANPWDVDVSPDGSRLFVVFSGTNDLYACDVLDDDYREIRHRGTLALGNNPRAVRVAPDGKSFWVLDALDFRVTAYDVQSLRKLGSVEVSDNPLGAEKLRGKILFYTALQPMVGRRWISCSSCHPDGQPDGRTWQNPEGLRNTQSLAGMAWTHPLHWSADRDETQDFEHTIRGNLMQGRGLILGAVKPDLGPPNKGLSADLDALAAYSASHELTLSPFAKGGLSPAAQRGRALFHSAETKCATCHSGPFLCDSRPGATLVRHDIGTGDDDPTEKMGPQYDTPTLHGIYRTAPYLHHGKAATLKDVLTVFNKGDRHGKTSHLSAEQIDDLVEFLKALPYEDPVPAAKAAGLVKVER